jgi:hypothetical protein
MEKNLILEDRIKNIELFFFVSAFTVIFYCVLFWIMKSISYTNIILGTILFFLALIIAFITGALFAESLLLFYKMISPALDNLTSYFKSKKTKMRYGFKINMNVLRYILIVGLILLYILILLKIKYFSDLCFWISLISGIIFVLTVIKKKGV